MTDNPPKPRTTSFFPLRKLKGNQTILKKPAVHLAHLEEEGTGNDEDQDSDDPSRIEGVVEEFVVWDEKCCYFCSSPEHIIHNCPLTKTSGEKKQLNSKEGMTSMKQPGPLWQQPMPWRAPKQRLSRHKNHFTDSLLESGPLSAVAWVENVGTVRINGESCRALLDNGAQINTIMPKYVSDHSLQVGQITNILGAKVTCMGLGKTYTRPLGYVIIWVQVDGVQDYDEDQIALVILDLSNFVNRVPIILWPPPSAESLMW